MRDPEPKLKAAVAGAFAQDASRETLRTFFATHRRIAVLTGVECSTQAGLPAYRDDAGKRQHRKEGTE